MNSAHYSDHLKKMIESPEQWKQIKSSYFSVQNSSLTNNTHYIHNPKDRHYGSVEGWEELILDWFKSVGVTMTLNDPDFADERNELIDKLTSNSYHGYNFEMINSYPAILDYFTLDQWKSFCFNLNVDHFKSLPDSIRKKISFVLETNLVYWQTSNRNCPMIFEAMDRDFLHRNWKTIVQYDLEKCCLSILKALGEGHPFAESSAERYPFWAIPFLDHNQYERVSNRIINQKSQGVRMMFLLSKYCAGDIKLCALKSFARFDVRTTFRRAQTAAGARWWYGTVRFNLAVSISTEDLKNLTPIDRLKFLKKILPLQGNENLPYPHSGIEIDGVETLITSLLFDPETKNEAVAVLNRIQAFRNIQIGSCSKLVKLYRLITNDPKKNDIFYSKYEMKLILERLKSLVSQLEQETSVEKQSKGKTLLFDFIGDYFGLENQERKILEQWPEARCSELLGYFGQV